MKRRRLIKMLVIVLSFTLILTACQKNAVNETEDPVPSGNNQQVVNGTELNFTGMLVYYNNPDELKEKTGVEITEYHQSPMLDSMDLPPVEERLPEDPQVLQGSEAIGIYGGTMLASGPDGEMGDLEFGFMGGVTTQIQDGKLVWLPSLFSSFEHNADYTEWYGTLRKGLKWSDGALLTTADMVFAHEGILMDPDMNPGGNSDWEDSAGNLPTLTVTDDITFSYKYPAPNTRLMYTIRRPWSTFIAPKHAVKQFHPKYDAGAVAKSEGYGHITWMDTFGRALEGNLEDFQVPTYRPWVMTTFVEGQLQVWERNPYFFQVDPAGNQLPYIDTIRYTIQEDPNALIMQAASGELDFAAPYRINLQQNYTTVVQYEKQGNYQLLPVQSGTAWHGMVMFNMDHPGNPKIAELFNQLKFKQALSLAMDREAVSSTLYKGLATALQYAPGPAFRGDDSVWTDYTVRDVDAANKLLDELGYKWNSSNEYRTFPDGSKLELTAMARTDSEDLKIAQMYAQQWNEIGVILVVRGFGDDAFDNKWDTMDYDLQIKSTGSDETAVRAHWDIYAEDPSEVFVAPAWGRWLSTDGEEGAEPPQYWKDAYAYTEAGSSMSEEAFSEGMIKHYKAYTENLLLIGGVAIESKNSLFSKVLITNRFGNIPGPFGDSEPSYMGGVTFFYKAE